MQLCHSDFLHSQKLHFGQVDGTYCSQIDILGNVYVHCSMAPSKYNNIREQDGSKLILYDQTVSTESESAANLVLIVL